MGLKSISCSQLLVAFILLYYNLMVTSATNMAQLESQHQTLGQTSTATTEHQHNQPYVPPQMQHQLQQQSLQSNGIAAHLDTSVINSANSVLHASNTGHLNIESQALPSTLSASSAPGQYVYEKEAAMQEILKHFNKDNELNDPYHILSELKRDPHDNNPHEQLPPPPPPFVRSLPNNMAFPWNLYDRSYAPIALLPPEMAGLFPHNFNPFETFPAPYPITPRFLPLMSYAQPIYVPYPFIMSPEMFYPSYPSLSHLANGYEDTMSRGAGSSRRPVSSQHSSTYSRNSPIYYVRLPPTPYMFLPSLGLGTTPASMSSYSNLLPYQSLPSFSSFSSIFNVPINFLANGKPTNIYQMSAPPTDIQNTIQFSNMPSSFNTRPPPPPPLHHYRPATSSHSYYNGQPSSALPSINYASTIATSSSSSSSSSSMPTASSSSSSLNQDSKLTALKRPYFFNGRPEDIYILPNNFNPLYSSENTYY